MLFAIIHEDERVVKVRFKDANYFTLRVIPTHEERVISLTFS